MTLLAIDPGNDMGWSLLSEGTLVACGLGDPLLQIQERGFSSLELETAIIEYPVVYPRSPVRPNDLIGVALKSGYWHGRLAAKGVAVRMVKPAEWKGKVAKETHHARLWPKLSKDEKAIVDSLFSKMSGRKKLVPKTKQHNVLDAVGLGLFQVGR